MTMRGEGALKQSMMIMGTGAILNIMLDPILMKLMGEYAIEGAAIATVLSQIVQALLTLPLQFPVPGKMNSFAESVQIMNQSTTSKSTAFHIIAIIHKWQKIVTKETSFAP